MRIRHVVIAFSLAGCLTIPGWGVIRAEPSFDQTAGYILNIVRAFRTAYVLHVVEHAALVVIACNTASTLVMTHLREAYSVPFVGTVDVGDSSLIVATLVIGFVDGDEFKAVSADLALVRSCVDCHNQHPRAVRKNFQQWDVMGALVVRLKRRVEGEGQALPPEPPKRAPGLLEGPPPPPTITPPWVR